MQIRQEILTFSAEWVSALGCDGVGFARQKQQPFGKDGTDVESREFAVARLIARIRIPLARHESLAQPRSDGAAAWTCYRTNVARSSGLRSR
jgi:hypothetical protein